MWLYQPIDSEPDRNRACEYEGDVIEWDGDFGESISLVPLRFVVLQDFDKNPHIRTLAATHHHNTKPKPCTSPTISKNAGILSKNVSRQNDTQVPTTGRFL